VCDHTAVDRPAHYAERLGESRGAAQLEGNPKLLVAVPEQENYQSARPFDRFHVFKVACPNRVKQLEAAPQLGDLRDDVPEILPLRCEVLAVGFAEAYVFKGKQYFFVHLFGLGRVAIDSASLLRGASWPKIKKSVKPAFPGPDHVAQWSGNEHIEHIMSTRNTMEYRKQL
jgi:hypothetical protein